MGKTVSRNKGRKTNSRRTRRHRQAGGGSLPIEYFGGSSGSYTGPAGGSSGPSPGFARNALTLKPDATGQVGGARKMRRRRRISRRRNLPFWSRVGQTARNLSVPVLALVARNAIRRNKRRGGRRRSR